MRRGSARLKSYPARRQGRHSQAMEGLRLLPRGKRFRRTARPSGRIPTSPRILGGWEASGRVGAICMARTMTNKANKANKANNVRVLRPSWRAAGDGERVAKAERRTRKKRKKPLKG